MRIQITITILLSTMVIACSPVKDLHDVYLDSNADSLFISGKISRQGHWVGAWVDFLGYHTFTHHLINSSGSEKVKLDGLILNKRSIITDSTDAYAVFGNETYNCRLQYRSVIEKIRNGRSALTSISNFYSTLKGQKIDKQPEPEISLRDVSAWGNIILEGQPSAFYYNWHYKSGEAVRDINNGWLVLNGDTIIVSQAINLVDDNGKSIKQKSNAFYRGGFELVKNNITYGAFDQYYSQVYIRKQLTEKEKKLIVAYFFIIACFT